MALTPEVVAGGIRFGEGPTWRPDHADLIVTSVMDGVLWRVDPSARDTHLFAATDGGPNGSALCTDGGVLVTQNGGMDWDAVPLPLDDPPKTVPATPSLQRVSPDGTVTALAAEGLQAPNDLVVGADRATVWFTDPPHYPPPEGATGRVWRYRGDEGLTLVADLAAYVNGIALSPDGRLLVVQDRGLAWHDGEGDWDWFVEDLSVAVDGFAFDRDGRVYACQPGLGLQVVDTDGQVVDRLELPGSPLVTNCCFGGAELTTLFATDSMSGTLVAWEGTPTPGLPLHPFVP